MLGVISEVFIFKVQMIVWYPNPLIVNHKVLQQANNFS